MRNSATAQRAQDNDFLKSHLLVVKPDTKETSAKVINFKASAEEVPSEPVSENTTHQEEAPQAAVPEVLEVLATAVEHAAPEAKPVQSIEEIKRKSEVLSRLTAKWDNLSEKRRKVENFAISHDGDTASATIRDAHGEVFESNSPKTIGQLIEFWKSEFSEAISKVEQEMREIA